MSQLIEFLQKNPLIGIVAPGIGKLVEFIIGTLTDDTFMKILGSCSLILGALVALLAGFSHFLTIREKLSSIYSQRKKNYTDDNDRRR